VFHFPGSKNALLDRAAASSAVPGCRNAEISSGFLRRWELSTVSCSKTDVQDTCRVAVLLQICRGGVAATTRRGNSFCASPRVCGWKGTAALSVNNDCQLGTSLTLRLAWEVMPGHNQGGMSLMSLWIYIFTPWTSLDLRSGLDNRTQHGVFVGFSLAVGHISVQQYLFNLTQIQLFL